MDRQKLIEEINAEISRLQKASKLISGEEAIGPSGAGRTIVRTAAARKRISDAQKARWARVKAQKAAEEKKKSDRFKDKKGNSDKEAPSSSRHQTRNNPIKKRPAR